jgi:hypothetical protein
MNAQLSLVDKLTSETLIEEEIARRSTKQTSLKTFNLSDQLAARQIEFLNPGTIVTIITQGVSEYVDGLTDAIKQKNEPKVRLHCEAIARRARTDALSTRKPSDLQEVPTIVDVLYGTAWVAKHLLISSDDQIALTTSIWSGGRLNEKGFRLLEHVKKPWKPRLQALSILIPPKLRKIERAMVDAVPADLSETHIRGPSVAWTAVGLTLNWDQPIIDKEGTRFVPSRKSIIPFYEENQQIFTVKQQQAQQQDTKQQQQQQQDVQKEHQIQQQQQQQQDAETKNQQQQQQQAQDNKQTEQQQQQDQQNADDQQHQFVDQHDAATNQQHESGFLYETELEGAVIVRPIDEERYIALLKRIDFASLDATQSVRELLRLREQLLTVGLG